jgi:hypothetical protein
MTSSILCLFKTVRGLLLISVVAAVLARMNCVGLPPSDDRDAARLAQIEAAELAFSKSDYDRAERWLSEACASALAPLIEARCLHDRGVLAKGRGRSKESAELYRKAAQR